MEKYSYEKLSLMDTEEMEQLKGKKVKLTLKKSGDKIEGVVQALSISAMPRDVKPSDMKKYLPVGLILQESFMIDNIEYLEVIE